jgi:hypothetical protein
MSWYERELMAKSRQQELEREVDYRRRTSETHRRRRPLHYWLLVALRSWIIGIAR